MIAFKTRKKLFLRRHKRLCLLLICLSVTIFAVKGFESKISVFSNSYLPAFARQSASNAVCKAVEQVLSEGDFGYEHFAKVEYANGRPSSVSTDAAAINSFKSRVVAEAEKECEKIHNSTMYIPLGAFTGLSLISNKGPKIPLSYCLTGSFSAELESSFESAGLNQTIHHIRLLVTCEIVTASVDYKDTMTFITDFEIAQSVLVGDIPTTYGGYFTPIR